MGFLFMKSLLKFFICLLLLGSQFEVFAANFKGTRIPRFGSFPVSVTVEEGNEARLPCIVYNLNDKSVTWMRKRDLHILTVDHITYSADERFKSHHVVGSDEWTLIVGFAQLRDAGVYECQVNADPKMSRNLRLNVIGVNEESTSKRKGSKVFVANNTASTKDGKLTVEILGPRERFIEEGSLLTLTCVVTSLGGPSDVIYWYHGNALVDYNSPRGGVNLQINKETGQTKAILLISDVGAWDNGMYSCVPVGSHPATVLVHVQKVTGEQEAAIHQGGVNGTVPTNSIVAPSSSDMAKSFTANDMIAYIFATSIGINMLYFTN